MCIRHGGNLREVRDTEHLLVMCNKGDALGNHLSGSSADARINLIEDHARCAGVTRSDDCLDSECDA